MLLQQVNPLLEGLQRPTLGCVRNFDVVSGEFIQMLHTGSDHYVCVSSIGCLPGKVGLYDSLFHDVISQEIEEQTNDLLQSRTKLLENFYPSMHTIQRNNIISTTFPSAQVNVVSYKCLRIRVALEHTTTLLPRGGGKG